MATEPKAKPETPPKAASKPAAVPVVPKIVTKDLPETTLNTPAKDIKFAKKSKIDLNAPETPKPEEEVLPEATPTPVTDSASSAKSLQKPAPKAAVKSVAKAEPSIAPKIQKWQEIRVILEKIKGDTLREISKSVKNGTDAVATNEPGGDIYDQASSERDRELGLLLGDREREKLHSIDEALLRIDEGDYGICEECDEDIPLGRLKAMPFTRHCVKCKSDLEKLQAQTKRFEEDRAYREIPLGSEEEEA